MFVYEYVVAVREVEGFRTTGVGVDISGTAFCGYVQIGDFGPEVVPHVTDSGTFVKAPADWANGILENLTPC